MAEEEVQEEREEKDAKYFTATLSKTEDEALIRRIGLMKKADISVGEMLEAGAEALVKSEKYQSFLKSVKEQLEE